MFIGFYLCWTDFFCLLGYYSVQDSLKQTFQDYLLVPCLRVKLSKKKARDLKCGFKQGKVWALIGIFENVDAGQ
jgi:hypothetical protein